MEMKEACSIAQISCQVIDIELNVLEVTIRFPGLGAEIVTWLPVNLAYNKLTS